MTTPLPHPQIQNDVIQIKKCIWQEWLIIGAAVSIWIGALLTRENFIPTACALPGSCPKVTYFDGFDQWALLFPTHWGDDADFYSEITQATAGLMVWATLLLGGAHLSWRKLASLLGGGTKRLILASALNGILMEVVRMAVRRPRPKVDPDSLRWLTTQPKATFYTSFYSGHTSFAFASATLTFFLLREFATKPVGLFSASWTRATWLLLAGLIAISTGVFRVLAFRHYLSDVVAGALFGILAAITAQQIEKRIKKGLPSGEPSH